MNIGFIGLGRQGKPLAANLIRAGYKLTVFDVRSEPGEELAALGARVARSARHAADVSDLVIICVVDDAQLRAVIGGNEGILDAAGPGMLVVVHSTVSPATILTLAGDLSAKGAELVDAPVSGGERGAVARTMSFMVGASAAAFARCRPLFEASGSNIVHCGAVGMGMRAKLVHQIVIAINRLAAAEGMKVGLQSGLTQEVLQQVIHNGGAQSRVADTWFSRSSRPFAIPLYYKDLQLALALAHELQLPVPGTALAQQYLDEIIP